VPARRKRRAYISSILAKNELSREGPYNRKLFRRMRHGQYLINPTLALRVEGEWRNIYELLEPRRLAAQHRDPERWYGKVYDANPILETGIATLRHMLERMTRGEPPVEAAEPPETEEPEEDDAAPEQTSMPAAESKMEPARSNRSKPSKKQRKRKPEQLDFDFF